MPKLTDKQEAIDSIVQHIKDKFAEENKEELTKSAMNMMIYGRGGVTLELNDKGEITCKAVDVLEGL